MDFQTERGLLTILQAQESDAPAYRELRLEALRNHPEAFSSDYALNQAEPPSYWSNRLQALGQESMLYFVIHNNQFIGMCGISRGYSPKTRHSATIWGVYIQSEWRGLQIAEALIAECAQWAKTQEVSYLN